MHKITKQFVVDAALIVNEQYPETTENIVGYACCMFSRRIGQEEGTNILCHGIQCPNCAFHITDDKQPSMRDIMHQAEEFGIDFSELEK